MLNETWRPIEGFAGAYSVSDLGRVRSEQRRAVNRPDGGTRLVRERVLKQRPDGGGYLVVWLRVPGGQVARKVASLVAGAFIGPKPAGLEVRHLNGDKTVNAAANLAYGTRAENMADAAAHGTLVMGERHRNARLTESAVREIRASSELLADLAAKHGVTFQHVSAVKRGLRWKHVGAAHA